MILANENSMLQNFVGISTWQSLVAITIFVGLQVGFWFFLKKIKIQFMWRVITGLGLGLAFGVVVQGIIGFLNADYFLGVQDTANSTPDEIKWIIPPFSNPDSKIFWIYELQNWAQFFKRVFINGIFLLTIPIVFIAIFRVTSKPGGKGLGRITLKGIALLLSNVAVAYTATFFLGYFLNVGNGLDIVKDAAGTAATNSNFDSQVIPNLISGYFPTNIFATLAGGSIIPVMVIAALIGSSVKILSKRKPLKMQAIRDAMDTGWDVGMSILMTFMKFMPLAVMSMISVSVISRPIGALASLGKIIGIGYLGILISILWLTLLIMFSGLNVKEWWKKAWRPLLQGFATQSSNATLPVTIDTIRNDLKISDSVTSTVAPLSTTVGLIACAGVQAGLVTSILWTGTSDESVHDMGVWVFFIMGLLVTVIASLGIAGIPGTATVVTVGVLGGLGFISYVNAIIGIIAPLDGLFDMGRTGANVLGAVTVAPVVAKTEGMIEEGSPLLNGKSLLVQQKILTLKNNKQDYFDENLVLVKTFEKSMRDKTIDKDQRLAIKANYKEQKAEFHSKYVENKLKIVAEYNEKIEHYVNAKKEIQKK